MYISKISITAIILYSFFVLTSCKKDTLPCPKEQEFCELVSQQDFDATGLLIDEYLATKKASEKSLQSLAGWLECKSCVQGANVLCNSCIETLPAQSELEVEFIVNGQIMPMTLDILMDDPLKFRGYH